MLRQQADILKGLVNLCNPVLFILIQVEVIEAFRNTVLNGRPFIERGGRILEDHLNIADNISVLFSGNLP